MKHINTAMSAKKDLTEDFDTATPDAEIRANDEHINSDSILRKIGFEELEEALQGLNYRIDHLYENQRKRGFEVTSTLKTVLGVLNPYDVYGHSNLTGEDPAHWSLPNGQDSAPEKAPIPAGFEVVQTWGPLEDKQYTGNGGWIYRRSFFSSRNSMFDTVDVFVRRRVWRRVSVQANQLEDAKNAMNRMNISTSARRAFNRNFLRRMFANEGPLFKKFIVQIMCENERADASGSFGKQNLRLDTDPPAWTLYTKALFPDRMVKSMGTDSNQQRRGSDASHKSRSHDQDAASVHRDDASVLSAGTVKTGNSKVFKGPKGTNKQKSSDSVNSTNTPTKGTKGKGKPTTAAFQAYQKGLDEAKRKEDKKKAKADKKKAKSE